MLSNFDLPIGWGELVKRTAKETSEDNGLGLAAQLAYYFFLALFPALLFLIAVAGLFASPAFIDQVVGALDGIAPASVVDILREQLVGLTQSNNSGILTFGVAAAVWSGSTAMVGLIDALNRAYDVDEARPWWKQRLLAIVLTLGVATFILAATALVLSGPQMADWAIAHLGMSHVFSWAWKILQWPLVFALIGTAFGLIYYFAPDVEQDFVWLTPGAVVATVLWLLGSLAFRFYISNFGSYNATYGTIGGVMVLMLWLYITGLVIVVGGELNSEIEHASPHGKDPGEKVKGERTVVGPRAAREWKARQQAADGGEDARPPRPAPQTQPTRAAARAGVLLTGVVAALFGRRQQ